MTQTVHQLDLVITACPQCRRPDPAIVFRADGVPLLQVCQGCGHRVSTRLMAWRSGDPLAKIYEQLEGVWSFARVSGSF